MERGDNGPGRDAYGPPGHEPDHRGYRLEGPQAYPPEDGYPASADGEAGPGGSPEVQEDDYGQLLRRPGEMPPRPQRYRRPDQSYPGRFPPRATPPAGPARGGMPGNGVPGATMPGGGTPRGTPVNGGPVPNGGQPPSQQYRLPDGRRVPPAADRPYRPPGPGGPGGTSGRPHGPGPAGQDPHGRRRAAGPPPASGGPPSGAAVPGGPVPGRIAPGGPVRGPGPGGAVPGRAAAGGPARGGPVPGGTVPGRTAAGGPVPARPVPGGPVPGGAVPGGPASGFAGPGGAAAGGATSGPGGPQAYGGQAGVAGVPPLRQHPPAGPHLGVFDGRERLGTPPDPTGPVIRQRAAAMPEDRSGDAQSVASIEADGVQAFARDLRALRALADLDYPEMAEVSHYEMKTLAAAAAGLRLPTLPVAVAFVRACGGNVTEWEERWQKLAEKVTAGAAGKHRNDGDERAEPPEPADVPAALEPPAPMPTAAPASAGEPGEVYVITSAKPRQPGW